MWWHLELPSFQLHNNVSTGRRQTWCPQSLLLGTWLPPPVPDPHLSIYREIVHLADPQVGLIPCPAWTSFLSPADAQPQSWLNCMKRLLIQPCWDLPPPLPRACPVAWVIWQVVDSRSVGRSFTGQTPHAVCPSWQGVDRVVLFHLLGLHGPKGCVRGSVAT